MLVHQDEAPNIYAHIAKAQLVSSSCALCGAQMLAPGAPWCRQGSRHIPSSTGAWAPWAACGASKPCPLPARTSLTSLPSRVLPTLPGSTEKLKLATSFSFHTRTGTRHLSNPYRIRHVIQQYWIGLNIKLVYKHSKNVDGWTIITMMIRYDKIVKVSHSLHHVESPSCPQAVPALQVNSKGRNLAVNIWNFDCILIVLCWITIG